MPRFRTSLWDIYGYLPEVWLDRISDTQVERELNNQRSYSFQMSVGDLFYPLVKHRKIVRLHDTDIDDVVTTVTNSPEQDLVNKYLSVSDYTGLELGDYVLVYEYAQDSFVGKTTAAVSPGTGVTINYDESNATGTLASGTYVKIVEDISEEKVVSGEYVRNPNSEVLYVTSEGTNTFTADVSYDYSANAVLVQPARSYVARVLTKKDDSGNVLRLSRMDFESGTGAIVQKVNFESYRISEITESREGGTPTANISCEHITFDLNDTMFFKDSRTDISYASKGSGQVIQDRVDLDTMLDNILFRHKDVSGNPISTKSFIKGNLERFEYSKGTVSKTATQSTVTGDAVAAFNDPDSDAGKLSLNSTMYIEGELTPYTIIGHSANTISLSTTIGTSASSAKYLLISQGGYTNPDDKIGTCKVVNGNRGVEDFTFTVTGGNVSHGAVFRVDDDDRAYYVDYVTNAGDVYLSSPIERSSGDPVGCSITRDEREISVSSLITSLGVLKQTVDVFTDDQQEISYWVNEDRSIDLIRKPIPDDRDPTSDLVVQYRNNQIRNLRSITREFEVSEFGNRIIPLGASSNWVNCESGIKAEILPGTITGTCTSGSNQTCVDTSGVHFQRAGVKAGMICKNTTTGLSGTILIVGSNSVQCEALGGSPVTFALGNEYEVDLRYTDSQFVAALGDAKKFRFGDPIHIFNKKQDFTIGEVTQITVNKAISGTATGGSDSTMVDSSTPSLTSRGAEVGMFIAKKTHRTPLGRINTITSTTATYDTAYADALTFADGTDYRISKVTQFNFMRDDGAGSPWSDKSSHAFSATSGVFDLLPNMNSASYDVDDGFYFGSNEKFGYINLELSRNMGSWTGEISWEYFSSSTSPSSWQTLSFNTKQITDLKTEPINVSLTNEFDPPSDWELREEGDETLYWVRMRVSTAGDTRTVDTQPQARWIKNREWRDNHFAGGMLRIGSGFSEGSMRRIMNNTLDTLTVNRKFDDVHAVQGADGTVAKNVGNTFVKGFGYKQLVVADTEPESDRLTFDEKLPKHAYYGGLLTVKTGIGAGQVYKIDSNYTIGTDNTDQQTVFRINRSINMFNPIPEVGDEIEVVANPQMIFSTDQATYNVSVVDGEDKARINLAFLTERPNFQDDMWIGARAYIVSGDYLQELYIADSSEYAMIADSDWVGATPDTNDKLIVIKETDLQLSLVEGLDFIPSELDDVSLLLKESGGSLTVGKHLNYRSTVAGATQTYISLKGNIVSSAIQTDSSKFYKNQLIFVGAKQIASSIYSSLGRGDQVQGQQLTVKNVITLTGTITTVTHDAVIPLEWTKLTVTGATFESSGVKAGMFINLYSGSLSLTSMINSVNSETELQISHNLYYSNSSTSIAGGHYYSIEVLETVEPLTTIPQPGDHVELIGFVHESSIRKNDIIEITNSDSGVNDPKILYRNAYSQLQDSNVIDPRYTVSFVDLYEYDKTAYPYDKYVIGDSIKIIDEDITGAGGIDLRVLKESYSPELPEDKSHTLEVGKKPQSFVRDDYLQMQKEVGMISQALEESKLSANIPVCMHWNHTMKTCTRLTPPNYFCESDESNTDGKMTKEKIRITKLHCQSYRPSTELRVVGGNTSMIKTLEQSGIGITTSDYNDAHTYPIDVNFILDADSTQAHVLDAFNTADSSASFPLSEVDIEIKKDPYGNVVPYNPIGKETGTGGYFRLKRDSGSAANPTVKVLIVAVGYKA